MVTSWILHMVPMPQTSHSIARDLIKLIAMLIFSADGARRKDGLLVSRQEAA